MRPTFVAVTLLALAGCARENACKHGTALLSYTLVGSAASADGLNVGVTVGNGAAHATSLTPNGPSGTIEIDFPSGYPSGQTITVVVEALGGTNLIGVGQIGKVLSAGCSVLAITVAGSNDDLSVRADLTGVVPSDMAGPAPPDLSVAHDLAGDDLSTLPDLMPACVENATRCSGNLVQTCTGGAWHDGSPCASFCSGGACVTPASCSGLSASCGSSNANSCCLASLAPGGAFARSYDNVSYTDNSYGANLSPFILDDYEVTVGRFRRFYNAYPASKPGGGSGKNLNDAADTGWSSSWDTSLPADQPALLTELACTGGTYTVSAGANENLPVNCIDWYTAYAFCIWDGGRLPTEAEWDFAAQCGGLQRAYPWSNPSTSVTIDGTYATYGGVAVANVGSLPKGTGCYGQLDLAGNVFEWAQDWYVAPYPSTSCNDCANLSASTLRVLRGGSFSNSAIYALGSARNNALPAFSDQTVGIRCARQP